MNPKTIVTLAIGLILFLLPFFIELEGLSLTGHITLGIFLLAALFWILEPIPIYATSLLVIFLQIIFLSVQGPLYQLGQVPATGPEPVEAEVWRIPAEALQEGEVLLLLDEDRQTSEIAVTVLDRDNGLVTVESAELTADTRLVLDADHWLLDFDVPSYTSYLNSLANPIIILFLGGFVLASAAVKYRLDRNLTRVILRPFGTRPAMVMLGLMLVTATLSAFMSNTATAAMMMTVIIPIVTQLDPADRYRIGIALCIPFAANVGGIATPIGTPPNAIVIGALQANDVFITFGTWMMLAVPLVAVLLFFVWWLLLKVYPPKEEKIVLEMSGKFDLSAKAIILYVVFGLTVVLWVTEAVHGLASSVVAFLPIAALTACQVIEKEDIRNLSWEVLWLMAGGIALGVAMQQTGLADYMIGLIRWELMGAFLVIIVFGFVAAGLSNFISNTVAASLLVPLAITLGASGILAEGVSVEINAIIIAVGASLGMALPISTPPNAIAMSTGMLRTPDMARMGIVIGIVGLVIALALSRVLWPALGL